MGEAGRLEQSPWPLLAFTSFPDALDLREDVSEMIRLKSGPVSWSRALVLGTGQDQEVTGPPTDSDSPVVWGAGHAPAVPEIVTVAQMGAALETGSAMVGGKLYCRPPAPALG